MMMVYIDNKIYLDEAIEYVEDSYKSLNGYYNAQRDYITSDNTKFTYVSANFSNVSDYIEGVGRNSEEGVENPLESIVYDVYWEDRSYEIDSLKQEIKDLKDEFKDEVEYQNNDKTEIKKLMNKYKDDLKSMQQDLKELLEDQIEYENLMEKMENGFELNNIGIGASSSDDFNYFGVEIDIENGVATYSNHEKTVVTDNLSWVEAFLISYYENKFMTESILEYIVEHSDFFDIEIVEK